MRRSQAWAPGVLALLLVGGCQGSQGTARAGEPPFPGASTSLNDLGGTVLAALTAGDTLALEAVRLTEQEHNEVIWPELPASRPEVNFPVELAWENVALRNRRDLTRTLPWFRGRSAQFQAVECRGDTEEFASFFVLTDCYIVFDTAAEGRLEAQVFKDVVVRNGGYKIFRYYEEAPRPIGGPEHVAGAAPGESLRPPPRPPKEAWVNEKDLIYDWNTLEGTFDWATIGHVELDDETLRDGLQNPSVTDPPIEDKIRLLHLMDGLGIDTADIGLPGAGPRAVADVTALAREIVSAGLSIQANCAARTVVADVRPIAEISQSVGIPIEACTFIGSSPIRQYAEGWTLDRMLRAAEEAVTFAVAEGLPVMMVTEDTTRAHPDTLRALYGKAIEWGAKRLCIADTVGHATPEGARALVRFVIEEIVEPSGADVTVDWHGHRDRGLGLANTLAAIQAGATRVHGTALGIGERSGNTAMELILVNLALLGLRSGDLTTLPDYCETMARSYGVPVSNTYPVVGHDAFRTGTGVHAAAIIKAEEKGDAWLADRVYSSVPASLVGRRQIIEIGPMAGLSNVKYWLRTQGLDADDEALAGRIFDAAKKTDHTLTQSELLALVAETT